MSDAFPHGRFTQFCPGSRRDFPAVPEKDSTFDGPQSRSLHYRVKGTRHMYEGGGLAATGSGVLLVGGYSVGLGTVVAIALAVIIVGALVYRLATRNKRYASS